MEIVCEIDGTYSARHDTKMLIYTAYCNQLLGVCGRISLAEDPPFLGRPPTNIRGSILRH